MVWSLNGFRVDVFEAYMAENSTALREFRLPEIKLTMTLKGLCHEDIAVVGQIFKSLLSGPRHTAPVEL